MKNFCLSLGPYPENHHSDRYPHPEDGSVDYVFQECLIGKSFHPNVTGIPHYDITCFIDGMHAPKLHLLETAMQEQDFLTSLSRNNFGKSAKAASQDYSRDVWKTLMSQGFTRSSEDRSDALIRLIDLSWDPAVKGVSPSVK